MASERTGFKIGTPVYVAVAICVLGAGAFAYIQRSARPAASLPLTPEANAYVRNLQLSDVSMKATGNYMKQTVVEIQGKITNGGDRPIDVVEIYCNFYDGYSQLVLRQRMPIVNGKMGGLKPGETKSFRLPFDELPESWNQAMPQLRIAAVKFL
ncbi:MAG TPA: FxLYD domain-containing protein [Bryobacteraceae bacterium]